MSEHLEHLEQSEQWKTDFHFSRALGDSERLYITSRGESFWGGNLFI
jgi:hypothetical protein